MIERSTSPPLRLLQSAAYVVVVAWGIKSASHLLSVVLIALLLTYVILPFPKWLMRRFGLRKSLAIILTVAFVAHHLSGHIRCLGRGRLSTAGEAADL